MYQTGPQELKRPSTKENGLEIKKSTVEMMKTKRFSQKKVYGFLEHLQVGL